MLKPILEANEMIFEGIYLVRGTINDKVQITFTRSDNLARVEQSMDHVEDVVLQGIICKSYFASGENLPIMTLVSEMNRYAKKM